MTITAVCRWAQPVLLAARVRLQCQRTWKGSWMLPSPTHAAGPSALASERKVNLLVVATVSEAPSEATWDKALLSEGRSRQQPELSRRRAPVARPLVRNPYPSGRPAASPGLASLQGELRRDVEVPGQLGIFRVLQPSGTGRNDYWQRRGSLRPHLRLVHQCRQPCEGNIARSRPAWNWRAGM